MSLSGNFFWGFIIFLGPNLNEYLQIALERTRQEMITLDQEMELIRRYLEIIQVRIGKKLAYEIKKGQNCGKISFPPMIIHPLVENAVKHGLAPKKDGGTITIECFIKQHDRVKITVSDTGPGIDAIAESHGVGLDNISKRLELIYGNQAEFIIKENSPSGLKVIVEIPVQ